MGLRRYKGILEVAQTIVENHLRDHKRIGIKTDELERKLIRHFNINDVKASRLQVLLFLIDCTA